MLGHQYPPMSALQLPSSSIQVGPGGPSWLPHHWCPAWSWPVCRDQGVPEVGTIGNAKPCPEEQRRGRKVPLPTHLLPLTHRHILELLCAGIHLQLLLDILGQRVLWVTSCHRQELHSHPQGGQGLGEGVDRPGLLHDTLLLVDAEWLLAPRRAGCCPSLLVAQCRRTASCQVSNSCQSWPWVSPHICPVSLPPWCHGT